MINKISLEQEIDNILSNSTEEKFPEIKLIIHTPDKDIEVKYLITLDVIRNFDIAVTDIVIADFLLPMGDYIEHLYKNRSRLEATISIKRGYKVNSIRYKTLILNVDKDIVNSKVKSLDKENLNKVNLIDVKIQLIPVELMLLKKLTHEGIYHNLTSLEVTKYSLTYELSKVKLYGSFFKLNINAYDSKYKVKHPSIIIPTGTKLAKIPLYLQDTYGLYNYTPNVYFQLDNDLNKNLYIWIYPTIDLNRVYKENKIGMIYNTVKKGFDESEKSYYIAGTQLKLVTNKIEISGDNYNELFDKGKGLEFEPVVENITGYNYNIKEEIDNTPTNMSLYVVEDKDGMDISTNIGLVNNLASVNAALTSKKIALLQTTIYNFTGLWGEDPSKQLLYPGMPIFYIYNTKKNNINKTVKLPGTLMRQHIVFQLQKKTMSSTFMLGVEKPLLAEENI